MNNLNREIRKGEVVIVDSYWCKRFMTVYERAFVVESGYGTKPYTIGKIITGEWLDGSGEDIIWGTWLSKEETKQCEDRNVNYLRDKLSKKMVK